MFFKLLKLAGLDVNAKIAELKAEFAFKAEQASEHVTHKARALAVVAGLLWCAGIMALLALIVGLAALYKWGEIHYGVFTGFSFVAAVLIALTGILVLAAAAIARQSAATPPVWRIVRDTTPPTQTARQVTENELRTAQGFVPPPQRSQTAKPEDLVEPLIVLLGQYLRPPETGYQALDDLLCQIGSRAQGTTEEAVARGSELVRNGNRAAMLSVLGAATLFGFLVARGAQHRDVQHGL
jgi:hypothetical protein